LVASPAEPRRVFGLGQHVFRSDDGGKSWANLTAYRTESIIGPGQHSLAISRHDPDQNVVANDYGAWRSLDGGLSGTGLNQGLPSLAVRHILAAPAGAAGVRSLVHGFGPVEGQTANPLGWVMLDRAIM